MKEVFFLLLISIGPSALGQAIIRGPYLTMATQNSIIISWRTDIACNSKVNYGNSFGTFNGGTVNNAIVTDHYIKLNGLQPETIYFYTIGTSASILQSNTNQYFKTLPITSATYNQAIRILAVGDVAKATPNEAQMRDAFLHYVDTNYIHAYLMLGDNAYENGLDNEFQHGFFDYFQQRLTNNTVLWPVLGNHEYANDDALRKSHAISYFDIFTLPTQGECGGVASNTEMYYSFDIGNVHFVNLDSYGLENVGGIYYGMADTAFSPQINWLKQDLSNNHLPWVIVSFHHPPYCMGTHNSDLENDLVVIREKLNPILERFNVDLVLNGHSHTYERSGFMHNHYGMEPTFDSNTHLVQKSSGMNDSSDFSCPYIKNSDPPLSSDSGLIYAVVGSGSAYPQAPQVTWPHNAMMKSNYLDNGSLLLTIEGNQLLGEWISTDTQQVIKDHFTIYKHVNRKKHIIVSPGDSIILKASWNQAGNYAWSTGDTSKEISILPSAPMIISVSDKKACITDSFFITIGAPNDIEEYEHNMIQISPNPVQDQLKIAGLDQGEYTCTILNVMGQILIQQKFRCTNSNALTTIPLGPLQNGAYICLIEQNHKKIANRRIVIIH